MILLGLEYASDGPELSNEEIERQFAELKGNFWHAQGILKMMSQLEPLPRSHCPGNTYGLSLNSLPCSEIVT